MQVGFLTACVRNWSLEECVAFASKTGFDALEIHMGHLPAEKALAEDADIRELFANNGLAISSIAAYSNLLDPDADKRKANVEMMKQYVDACVAVGTDVLCALAGMPIPGKSKEETIAAEFKEVFAPITEYAADKGVKIAFENYFVTLIGNFDQWDAVIDAVPMPNLGFNYDPSHLIWQGIDYLAGVDRYADRIFHTHAKDTEIRHDRLAMCGNQNNRGWWRYVIPGFGSIEWGKYVARLRKAGFDGVMSIEHEDNTFTPEEGLEKGLANLRLLA